MASLRNHKVVEVWKVRGSDARYHITESDRVLRTSGPRCGAPKLVYTPDGHAFNCHGVGRRATATEWKMNFSSFKSMERER